jgi:Xaa-Pro aminopeptidase
VWDRFSPAELERRFALTRNLMGERDLTALLVFGTSATSRASMANPFWLTNHLDLHHCYVVVPLDAGRETALYTGLTNHVPNAREVSDVPVIEWGGYDPAERVAARLRELGAAHARIGLVGANATFSMGMPYQHHEQLRSLLPDAELVDVTAPFQRLRLVKSDEEIEWLRRAAALTDDAMRAVAEAAVPGTSEAELVAAGEAAYRAQGGIPRIMFLRSMSMNAPTGCLPAQNPSGRRLRPGDVVITELSASYWGYTGQIHRPIFVDAEPTAEWARLVAVAREAYVAIAGALRPGATELDALAAAEPIREAGYAIYDDLIHGYGVDIQPPVVDRLQFADPPSEPRWTLQGGMTIVIQPNPVTPDERMGLQLGALTVVRDGGAESLHAIPFDALVGGPC